MFVHLNLSDSIKATSDFLSFLLLYLLDGCTIFFLLLLFDAERLNVDFLVLEKLLLLEVLSLGVLDVLKEVELMFDHGLVLFFDVNESLKLFLGMRGGEVML